MKKLLILSAALLLTGCASKNVLELSEVAEISPNRYMLAGNYSVLNDSGFLVNDLIKHGTDFCQKRGQIFHLIEKEATDGKAQVLLGPGAWIPGRRARAQITFECR
jgi:hypothetical protein